MQLILLGINKFGEKEVYILYKNKKNSYCYDLMVGNAIYGAVWTAVLWNPSKYYVGLYLGAGLGFLYYCFILS